MMHLAGVQQRGYARDFSAGLEPSIRDLASRIQQVVDREQHVVEGHLARNGVVLADGVALPRPHRVLVSNPHHECALTADHVLIATGSAPAHCPASRSTASGSSTPTRCRSCRSCRAI
ncbi:MAG: hypothetical protein U0P30_01500 [Vicinamibacterales bacterium]